MKYIFLILLIITHLYANSENINFQKFVKKIENNIKNKNINYKLNKINSEINLFKYRSDISLYNEKDYWATPIEFFKNKGGDCEDYVIFKYYLLKKFNIGKNYKFIFIKYKNKNHLILSAEINNKNYILDNNFIKPYIIKNIENTSYIDPEVILKRKILESI